MTQDADALFDAYHSFDWFTAEATPFVREDHAVTVRERIARLLVAELSTRCSYIVPDLMRAEPVWIETFLAAPPC